uniref:Putative secreted protein n=1 Tax=Anopheles marajoara TaxID=58244 RepID=A0A2M4CCX7_9DIPT
MMLLCACVCMCVCVCVCMLVDTNLAPYFRNLAIIGPRCPNFLPIELPWLQCALFGKMVDGNNGHGCKCVGECCVC